MNTDDALYRLLADQSARELDALARPGDALERRLREEYLVVDDASVMLDSQEAAEAAEVDERTMDAAAFAWTRIAARTRNVVLRLATDPDDFEDLLDIRLDLDGPAVKLCPLCATPEPGAALDAIRDFEAERIVRESHFALAILTCPECTGSIVAVFMESIDWDDGDDSQAWLYVRVSFSQAQRLRVAGEDNAEATVSSMKLNGRHLRCIHPRGDSSPTIGWASGPVVILPHD